MFRLKINFQVDRRKFYDSMILQGYNVDVMFLIISKKKYLFLSDSFMQVIIL